MPQVRATSAGSRPSTTTAVMTGRLSPLGRDAIPSFTQFIGRCAETRPLALSLAFWVVGQHLGLP